MGGTMFNEGNGAYWSATNSSTWRSALSYIPEMAFNDSPARIASGGGIFGGGGGASVFFTKPSWQSGSGMPNDNARDLPDVALSASADHDGYRIVEDGNVYVVGGTSAATPVFAAMVALLNQYLVVNGSLSYPGLGNINPALYRLAQTVPGVFHDITLGNNIVPCDQGSPDCKNGSLGYSAGPGYDQVTGLGSVDAYNLITQWNPPQISVAGIGNAANYKAGGISPGEIIVVYGGSFGPAALSQMQVVNGQVSTTLGNTRIYFDGTPAPMIYAQNPSLSCVVPYEVAGKTSTQVQVEYQGIKGNAIAVPVVASVPGIFSVNQLGTGPGAIQNWPDYSLNGASNRVAAGGYIMAYGTGEGKTDIAIDGQIVPLMGPYPKPLLGPWTATVGGKPATVTYSGGAPRQRRRSVPGERANPSGPGDGHLRPGHQGRQLHQHGRTDRGGEVAGGENPKAAPDFRAWFCRIDPRSPVWPVSSAVKRVLHPASASERGTAIPITGSP